MGYQTEYKGEFKFSQELSASDLAYLKKMLGEDSRDHPEWGIKLDNYYVSLEFLDDFSGLRWDGMEKTYNMPQILDFILTKMQERLPEFSMDGRMVAQGEDVDDLYEITIVDGVPIKRDLKPTGRKVQCPHCEEYFYLT